MEAGMQRCASRETRAREAKEGCMRVCVRVRVCVCARVCAHARACVCALQQRVGRAAGCKGDTDMIC